MGELFTWPEPDRDHIDRHDINAIFDAAPLSFAITVVLDRGQRAWTPHGDAEGPATVRYGISGRVTVEVQRPKPSSSAKG